MHDDFVVAVSPHGEWEKIPVQKGELTSEKIANIIASASALITYVPLSENLFMWSAPREPYHFKFNAAATAIRCAHLSYRAGIPINLDAVSGTRGRVVFTGGHDLTHGAVATPIQLDDAAKVFVFCNLAATELKKVK